MKQAQLKFKNCAFTRLVVGGVLLTTLTLPSYVMSSLSGV